MKSTQYFERTLQSERCSVANEFFERTAGFVFEKEQRKASIEVRVWSTSDLRQYRRIHEISQASITCNAAADAKLSQNVHQQEAQHICEARKLDAPAEQQDNAGLLDTNDLTHSQQCLLKNQGPPQFVVIDLDLTKLRRFIQDSNQDFRVFYLRQRNSFSRLQVTKQMYQTLLDECLIFPKFSEYVIDFRWKVRESEIGPPPIKFRLLRGNGYECAYVIRYVEYTNRPEKSPWSLRQFAVYHKYVPEPGIRSSTWLLVGASQRTELSLDNYVSHVGEPAKADPFELYTIFLDTAIASWRPYLVYLLERVAHVSDKAVCMMIGKDDDPEAFVTVEVTDHQILKEIEDRAADVVLCLDSTMNTLSTLVEWYQRLHNCAQHPENLTTSSSARLHTSDMILLALMEQQREVAYSRKKVEALLTKAQNTRALISSLLERQTGYNLDQQMSALQNLEKQAQDENAIMRHLAEKSSRDSTSVRILTIITLIYLPCTVVSSFYSTQFVKQDESSAVVYTQNAWLFFAVSIPLTFLTILVWYTWSNFRAIRQLCFNEKENQEKGFRERVDILGLLKRRRELPR